MNEYIKKSVLVDMFQAKAEMGRASGYGVCFDNAAKMVEMLPAADVAPVRHGRWCNGTVCSICGDNHGPRNAHQVQYYKFCPNCGAKMDEQKL